jgi:hypothetical protein
MLKKELRLAVAVTVLSLFTACGEGGIDDNDKNRTTVADLEHLADEVNSSDIEIPDINVSDTNVSSITDTDMLLNVGHYIDSAVEGVTYNCGDQSGVTDENGTFRFGDGVTCTFTIGNIVLEEVDTDTIDNDDMIVLEDDIDDARFLQTLDNDGNPDNGIEISSDVSDLIAQSGIDTIPTDEEEIKLLFEALKANLDEYNGVLVSVEEAQKHIDETIKELEATTDDGVDSIFENI